MPSEPWTEKTYTAFVEQAMLGAYASHVATFQELGLEVDIVTIIRGLKPAVGQISPPNPLYLILRTFPGQDELEDFLEQARQYVAIMDLDPTHTAYGPLHIEVDDD